MFLCSISSYKMHTSLNRCINWRRNVLPDLSCWSRGAPGLFPVSHRHFLPSAVVSPSTCSPTDIITRKLPCPGWSTVYKSGPGFPYLFLWDLCGKSSQGMSKSQITSLYFSVDFTDFDLKNSCFGDKFPLPLLQVFLVIPSLLQKLCLVGCLYHTVHFRWGTTSLQTVWYLLAVQVSSFPSVLKTPDVL